MSGGKLGLVLGGGGLIGLAYHAGALKALDDEGVDVTGADVIVGTSAGAIIGSYLASGWKQTDFYDYAYRRHPNSSKDPESMDEQVAQIFEPKWNSAQERVRRYVGSAFALASSRGHLHRLNKGRAPLHHLRKFFPSGMYATDRTRERLSEELPHEWPREGLMISTVELYSGKRVAFGHPSAPEAPLPDAVLASTAIPGVFPPVRINGGQYVDGGAHSATSLDLAVHAGCDRIICIAPLGYRGEGAMSLDPKVWGPMLTRQFFARSLKKEVVQARSLGIEVLVIRPSIDELRQLGSNAMRSFDRQAVTTVAREGTKRLLHQKSEHPLLERSSQR